MSGRIVSAVDFYDALTMDRVYRPAFSHEKAMEMMREQRGKAFDPQIVDCFDRHHIDLLALRLSITEAHMSYADLMAVEQR